PHTAHFTSDFQFNFRQFSTTLVSELISVPLPSPASGFTYQFDPSLGVFQRTTQSFGPILAERAETIGARRVAFGVAAPRVVRFRVAAIHLRYSRRTRPPEGAGDLHARQCPVARWPTRCRDHRQFH